MRVRLLSCCDHALAPNVTRQTYILLLFGAPLLLPRTPVLFNPETQQLNDFLYMSCLFEGPECAVPRHARVEGCGDPIFVLGAKSVG